MVRAILDGPIAFLDTACGYGESERRIGVVSRERGGPPPGFILTTKVDADAHTRVFGGVQVRRCVEQSLMLLDLDRLPLVYLHDPEYSTSVEQAMAPAGPVACLQRCREAGLIDHLGIACGPIALALRFVETGAFEVVLAHNRYTLLNVAAGPLWDAAARRGMAAVNAAPFGGGILGKGLPARLPRVARTRQPSGGALRRAPGAPGRRSTAILPARAAHQRHSRRYQSPGAPGADPRPGTPSHPEGPVVRPGHRASGPRRSAELKLKKGAARIAAHPRLGEKGGPRCASRI
jgi:aryl-alcohol dehydrogenase-like predicted oxidoreductase